MAARVEAKGFAYQREQIIKEVLAEFDDASAKHGAFNSAHEAYAVMLEEVDELWEEVKKKKTKRDMDNMRHEAAQIAAAAMRFMLDITPVKEPKK